MAVAHGFVLLAFVALLAPCSTVDASGYDKLKEAILQANKNAAGCGSQNCTVTLTLNEDVKITEALPPLSPGASLEIVGACGIITYGKCIVDGQLKLPALWSEVAKGPLGKLVLKNLIFENCKGGALMRVWAAVNATNVIFQKNVGGAVIGASGESGYPPHTFITCRFLENTQGSAITFRNITDGLGWGSNGTFSKYTLFVSSCEFRGNQALYGGAVYLSSLLETPVFESTVFEGNLAGRDGGAVFLAQVKMVQFRNVTFRANTALSGYGGAVFSSGYFENIYTTFCTCKFMTNYAPKHPSSNNIRTYAENSHTIPFYINTVFCATPIPPGFSYEFYLYWGHIIKSKGGQCKKIYCSA